MQCIFLLQSFRCNIFNNKSRITIIAELYLAQQVSKNLPIIIYEINYDSTMLCSSMDFVEKNRISGQSPSSIIPMAYKCTRKTYAQTHVIITEQGDTNKGRARLHRFNVLHIFRPACTMEIHAALE